jgi:hypothetical protein
MKSGIKHLIECHCVLPQYRGRKDTVYHKFIVFSIIDESDTVIPKYVQCNNCDVIHKIYDICKSEIASGKDELRSVTTPEIILFQLPSELQELFKFSYKIDLATLENVKYILDNQLWNQHVVLTRDVINDETTGKILKFPEPQKYLIEDFLHSDMV